MIRPATIEDFDEILPRLRAQEVETIAALGLDARKLVRQALGPYAFTGLVDGRPACMWGVIRNGLYPRVWLLTTSDIEKRKIEFLRVGLAFVRGGLAEFGTLTAEVACKNEVSKAWLEWLGFRPTGTMLRRGYEIMVAYGD